MSKEKKVRKTKVCGKEDIESRWRGGGKQQKKKDSKTKLGDRDKVIGKRKAQ